VFGLVHEECEDSQDCLRHRTKMTNNPWINCFLGGEYIFETRFLLYGLGYILISFVGNWCHASYHADVKKAGNNPDALPSTRSIKALIASRPTVIAATIHSVATSVIAVGILVIYYNNLRNDYSEESPWTFIFQGTKINLLQVWQRVGLPISLSYFVSDCYYYCLPRKDMLLPLSCGT